MTSSQALTNCTPDANKVFPCEKEINVRSANLKKQKWNRHLIVKTSKTGQGNKSLMSAFGCLLTDFAKV